MIIFISGAPGSGKTVCGRKLAEKLNTVFVDTDEIIKKKEEKDIPTIFREKGEEYFRWIESRVIKDILEKMENGVVSLGGGAVTIPQNLHAIRKKGVLINLYADPQILINRISPGTRPLLEGDTAKKIDELLKKREKWYRISDFSIDTSSKSPDDVVKEILSFLDQLKKQKIVRVNLRERSYDVIIGNEIFNQFTENRIKELFREAGKCVIVSSRTVRELIYNGYQVGKIIQKFFSTNFRCFNIDLPEGERTKDIFYAVILWENFSQIDVKRNDFVAVLGGGVLGDLVGFAASAWLRGIRYVNIPTTLLSQVDSAIGGKTGVNTKNAKNMIGTFHQPSCVLCDIGFIKTLPNSEFLSGIGEIIKYAISLSKELFEFLGQNRSLVLEREESSLLYVVSESAKIKADIVSNDEREEEGLRMLLNFGHTIGHAIESSMEYKIPHGIAVAYGVKIETKISDIIQGKSIYPVVKDFIESFGMDFESEFRSLNKTKFFSSLKLDKKTKGEFINFILIEDIGKSRVEKIRIDEFSKIVESVLQL